MAATLLEILKKTLLSPSNETLLQLVRERAVEIAEAIEEGEIEFSEEEIRQLEVHSEWTAAVYQALAGPEEVTDEEKDIAEAIQQICESEDAEIGSAFVEALIATLPEEFREWDRWFQQVPLAPTDYQAHLRRQTVVIKGMPYTEGLIKYGLTPGTFFEASRGIELLIDRLIRTALGPREQYPRQPELVPLFHWLREQHESRDLLSVDVRLREHRVTLDERVVVPYRLLVAEVRGTPDCPPEAAEPLLHWMIKVAQRKSYFFAGYRVTMLDEQTIRLIQDLTYTDAELALRWGWNTRERDIQVQPLRVVSHVHQIALMAHLLRRAGFGAPYAELEACVAKGYEATVEELLHPETQPALDQDIVSRYKTEWVNKNALDGQQEEWVFRMINTKRPLEEKIALFWHGILYTGHAKAENLRQQSVEFDIFRQKGLGNFRDLLMALAVDPAMVHYLDNRMSHKGAMNANWGRELLELFSLGIGMDGKLNYSEDDVREAARAFTGWTVVEAIPRYPDGRYLSKFAYNPKDHDDGPKTFLGETGNWNGEDIINILVKQPAAARFVSRHLYNFFVADEPQVPAWQHTPPRDMEAIKQLEAEYFRSNYDIRSMLRLLFNSDFFKNSRFAKVKSPVETVVGTTRLVGDFTSPEPGFSGLASHIRYMGQDLLNPPSVEGWHTGKEWINSGRLVERINFTTNQVGNINLPGVRAIIERLRLQGATLSPEHLVNGCLELLGSYVLADDTYRELVAVALSGGEIRTGAEDFSLRVAQVLQLIVATTEYLSA